MFYQSKEIRRKMIAIVSCDMAFFTFAYATPFVSAFSDEQTYDGQRIPDYMQPSSIIKYVTDKEYVIHAELILFSAKRHNRRDYRSRRHHPNSLH